MKSHVSLQCTMPAPVTVVAALLLILSLHCDTATSSTRAWRGIGVDGKCEEQCSRNRAFGDIKSYRFKCSEVYKSKKGIKICKQNCEECPKEVCDEFFNATADSANDWHCPPAKLAGKCEDICDSQRRKYGEVDPLTMNCDRLPEETVNYGPFSYDRATKNDCDNACGDYGSSCPSWVCDKKKKVVCPPLRVDDDKNCTKFCESHRTIKHGDGSFQLNCSEVMNNKSKGWENMCDAACGNCPRAVCVNETSDSEKAKLEIFHCPAKYDEGKPPADKITTYKGTCQQFCEASRGGGWRGYELNCGKRYTAPEEIDQCKQYCILDCSMVCDPITNSAIKCYPNDEMRRREQDAELSELQSLEDREAIADKRLARTEEKMKVYIIGNSVFFLVLIVVVIGVVVCVVMRKSNLSDERPKPRREKPGKPDNQSVPATPIGTPSEANTETTTVSETSVPPL